MITRYLRLIIFFLALGFSIPVMAKNPKPTDYSNLKCTYQFKYLKDSTTLSYSLEEPYIALIGENLTKSYFYRTFRIDSLRSTPEGNRELTAQINELAKNPANWNRGPTFLYRGDFPAYLYKDYKKEKITVTDNVSTHNFIYEDVLNPQDWVIQHDTMTILGYSCQKATCNFRGRDWVAWFAPDIPINEGPWKFQGLPGLIMKLCDTESHYSFEMAGLEQVKEPIFMNIGKRKPQKIDRIKFLKLLMNVDGSDLVAMDLANVEIQSNGSNQKKYDYIERDYK